MSISCSAGRGAGCGLGRSLKTTGQSPAFLGAELCPFLFSGRYLGQRLCGSAVPCLPSPPSAPRSRCAAEPPSVAGMTLWSLLEVAWVLPTRSPGSPNTQVKLRKVLAWPWVGRGCSDPCQRVVSLLPRCFPAAAPPNLSLSILLVPGFQPLLEGAPGAQPRTRRPGQGFSFVHGDFPVPSLSLLSCSHLPAGGWSRSWHPGGSQAVPSACREHPDS